MKYIVKIYTFIGQCYCIHLDLYGGMLMVKENDNAATGLLLIDHVNNPVLVGQSQGPAWKSWNINGPCRV